MWPEAWNADGVSLEQKRISIADWKKTKARSDEYKKKARERQVIRDGTVDHQQAQRIPGSRDMPVPALAAAHCDFAKWKPWLDRINKRLDLEIPDMPLLQRDLREHLLPPKQWEKTVDVPDMPWNCCVARPVFEDDKEKHRSAKGIAERMGPIAAHKYLARRFSRGVGCRKSKSKEGTRSSTHENCFSDLCRKGF
jgi:hypothetical protein